ncbi:MAG: phosphatase PAP2 family protein [Solirubrobacterales bacterium]|nr:phosphatase PAP2 family protein [Solirubrobacterales bacterium]MCO5326294.1 phosphatase PAP2 family protein [Solirubrobacterales bacterium]
MLERPKAPSPAPAAESGRRLVRWARAGRTLRAVGWADQRLLLMLRRRGHSPALDGAARALGNFGEFSAGWTAIGLTGAALHGGDRGRWLRATAAAPLSVAVNYGVKLAVGRERPLIEEHPPLSRAPSKLSFPSAHSTSAVTAATVFGRVAPGARVPLLALAAAICLSRPYLGMHYPSDVLAGVALGTLLGRAYPLPPAQSPWASAPPGEAIA